MASYDEELFEFFGDTITQQQLDRINKIMTLKDDGEPGCLHSNISETDGINICKECGCEIDLIDFQPEWRYYGSSDSRSASDPSRCHRSKESTRGGIHKVFQDARLDSLPKALREKTEKKYKEVVKGETIRGKNRKSIVAACLLYVFFETDNVHTSEQIRILFGLSKNEMSAGLTLYYQAFPDSRTLEIKPVDMIRRVMLKAKLSLEDHYKKIYRLARCLENVDPIINRSNPQSVAAAIVYLYICLIPGLKESMGLTKTRFAKEMELSDITISKIVRTSASILGMVVTL